MKQDQTTITAQNCFYGTDSIALPPLDWLAGRAVRWHPSPQWSPSPTASRPRPEDRAGPVKQWRLRTACPFGNRRGGRPTNRDWLAAQQADVALVLAYGHILQDDFIVTPRLGTLNLHASILPRYRGASPIQTAIAQGEPERGSH